MTGEAQHFKRPAVTFAGIPAGTLELALQAASRSDSATLAKRRCSAVLARASAR